MRIGIDITQAIYETGVSVYTRELVRALVKNYPEHEYVLYGGSLRRGGEMRSFVNSLGGGGNISQLITPISPTAADIIWNRLHTLPIERLTRECDVFHTSDWTEPPSKFPKVTTIHDFAPLKFASDTNPRIVSVHKRRLGLVKKESTIVIVPSHSTKKDAIQYGIEERRVHVVPEASSEIYHKLPKAKVNSVLKKYKIIGRYALCVGRAERKNLDRTIKAFLKVKDKAGLTRLVVVGGTPNGQHEFVQYVGHISTQDLVALHCGASVMLYASLYEGFGLPILESYACECPVVTSNVSSMPEVAGDAAILVDPYDVGSISEGIVIAIDKSENLIKKARIELKKYSWDKVASETLKLYKKATQS